MLPRIIPSLQERATNEEISSLNWRLLRRSLYSLLAMAMLIGASSYAHAQPPVDSLAERITQNLNDTVRINVLNKLAASFMYTNPDTAIVLSSHALAISKINKWEVGVAQSKGQLGSINYLKGDYTKALKYYHAALSISKGLGKSSDSNTAIAGKIGAARRFGNIGSVYYSRGNYPQALDYYFKSIKIFEEMKQSWGIALSLGNIGGVYYSQEDYGKALEYFFRALKLDRELNRLNGISANLGNIANIFKNQGAYSLSLKYYFEALNLDEEQGNLNATAITLGNIGIVYRELGDSARSASASGEDLARTSLYPTALDYYFKALGMAKSLGDKNSVAINLGSIGSLYIDLGEYNKSEEYLQNGLILSKQIGARSYLKHHYQFLSHLYHKTQRPAQAFDAYKLYIIYRDSMDNEANTKAQTRTEMKYEYEKAELLKEQEEKDVRRLASEARSRRDNLQYSVVLICLLVIGVVVAMLGRLSLPVRMAEGIIFFSFLILFEFLLVLADPYIEEWSGGAPGFKLLFNAGIAAFIFPLHSFFEVRLKGRLVKE